MVRREIKNFELITDGGRYPCQLPCSVHSVLEAAGASLDTLGSSVSFESKIYVDDVALAMRNFYLRIRGVHSPAHVYLGDRLIGECDGKTPVYNFNAAGIMEKGDNLLSICFCAEDGCDLRYAGLAASVEILRFSGAIIDRARLTQEHTEEGVNLGISLDLIGNPESVRAVATLTASSGQIYYAGLTRGKGSIAVSDPLFWWPKGLGVQNLYRLTITLYGDTDIEDTVEMRVGLRTVESCAGGALLINGVKIVPMGAVYLAEEEPDLALADRRTNAFVTSAAMSDYNCLVVPKNSPRPTASFYELCDMHGIMVIEEHGSISQGVIDTIRRNAYHTCLAEIDLSGEAVENAEVIKKALPDLPVKVTDSLNEYVRYPSFPSMKTIRTAIPEGERSLFSYSIEAIAEEGAIRDMLLAVADRYPYPADLSSFAYASALAAANKVGETVKSCRLSEGELGRAVFDRLGDSSLAISPSAIDHRARWKPLQYYCRRHFAPVKLYAENKGGEVSFSVVNSRRIDFVGNIEYRLADSSNYTIFRGAEPVELEALGVKTLVTLDLSDQIKGRERECYLEFWLKEGSSQYSRDLILFVPEKHFEFKRPKLKTVITGSDRRFSLTVSADVFVKDLELDFDGVDAVFTNNYIDLTGESPVKIDFTVNGGPETTYHLKDVMQIRSVVDLK